MSGIAATSTLLRHCKIRATRRGGVVTEAEIYEFISVHQGTLITLLQWWASVSFALVALAHFGRNSLNLFLVSIVLLLYVAFSLFAYGIFLDQVNRITQLLGDLSSISGNASDSSLISSYLLRSRGEVGSTGDWARFYWPLYVALIGTFLGSVAYVIYAYRGNRKRQRA